MKQISRNLQKSGIYMIVNTINGNKYIGSSKNIYQRLLTHRSYLRHDKHYNKYLQNAWNKYGETNFDYSIIEFCSEEDRINREQYYVDTLKPEYNISIEVVELPPYTKETRLKQSITRKQRMKEGLIPKTNCKELFVYDLEGNFIKKFNTITEAVKELNLKPHGVTRVLSGEIKQHHGYLLSEIKLDKMPPYKKTKKVDKQYKPIRVYNNLEYYEFKHAKECSEFFKVHIVSVRGAILHKRKFLHKYTIEYKEAV